MLIRVCDHFRNNPKRIDKLIAIKGLPEEWFFHEGQEGKELKKPWEPDIEKNIPADIRNLCDPIYITFKYPPIEKGAKEIIDRRQILGVRIDYNSEPGRQMWDDVERYVEETIPRNERIPVPVVCARDEHTAFETYMPRRTAQGSLEFVQAPVPFVDLTKYAVVKNEPISPPVVVETPPEPAPVEATQQETSTPPLPADTDFVCGVCGREFRSETGLRIHLARPKNHSKEKAGVK